MSKKKHSNDFIDIEKFRGIYVDLHLGETIKRNAELTVKKLKKESPRSKTRKDLRKRYAGNWRYNYYEQYEMAVVYNRKANLTYFLEHGHDIVNAKGKVGWSPEQVHIMKVFDSLPESMNKIIKQTDIDFEIY